MTGSDRIDVLREELARVREKAHATDKWLFGLIGAVLLPFLGFTAYCTIDAKYRELILALPYLSILGVALAAVLYNHYAYADAYGSYLERRLNRVLGSDDLRDSLYARPFYRGITSVVGLGFQLSFLFLLALNAVATPLIAKQLEEMGGRTTLGWLRHVVPHYWGITAPFALLVSGIFGWSLWRARRRARALVEHDEAPASGRTAPRAAYEEREA